VFVSRLLEAGTDPMAIRLAILAHHYHEDWDWTDAGLAAAQERLGRWRAALAAAGPGTAAGPGAAAGAGSDVLEADSPGAGVLGGIRERLADDLDAPGALAVVDAWADAVLAAGAGGGAADGGAAGGGAIGGRGQPAGLVRDAVDALLGVTL
jgi:L-cysteine:1D-myo-inositol 2-amino-2-deoxy-alpha-D-glucopyranoside ligase